MKIEIVLMVHNFQHRLCWDLASVNRQLGLHEDFEIAVSVASLPENGKPTTEEICKFYNEAGLRVKHLIYEDKDRFAYRGYVRNDQVRDLDEDTTHVLFSDCDMVYDPKFFKELIPVLEDHKDNKTVISVGRLSSYTHGQVDRLVEDQVETYPMVNIDYAALQSVCIKRMRNVGAGYFQLVAKEHLGGTYIKEGTSRDGHLFKQGQKARSDIQFRKRIGSRTCLVLNTEQYHLNHVRDNEVGEHLETQR